MATDYDAPRTTPEDEPSTDVLALTRPRGAATTQAPLIDESKTDENMDLPDADLSELELTVQVVPQQDEEFLCESCFLVRHRSQLVQGSDGRQTCAGCHR